MKRLALLMALMVSCTACVLAQNQNFPGGGAGGTFGPNYSVGGGIAQAQTVSPTGAVTNVTLVNGYTICWLPIAANTGAAPTLAGSGTSTFTAKPITKYGTVALVANDITTAGVACAIYDGTEFQLQNPQTTFPSTLCTSDTTTGHTYSSTDRGSGCVVRSNGSNMTDTFPDAGSAGWANGASIIIINKGTGSLTLNRQTSSTFTSGTSSGLTSITITAGQATVIDTDPDGTDWIAVQFSPPQGQVPTSAGAAPTTSGLINYDTTANLYKGGVNSATDTFVLAAAGLTGDRMPFSSGNGLIKDTGASGATIVNTPGAGMLYVQNNNTGDAFRLDNTNTSSFLGTGDIFVLMAPAGGSAYSGVVDGGSVGLGLGTSGARPVVIAPNKTIVARFPSGGGIVKLESTAPSNVASSAATYEDSTQHEEFTATAGSSTFGMKVRVQPGIIHQTAKTAAITTATLCAASAGACNVAGNYTIEWAFTQVGTACGTPGAGGVTFLLTWTDQNGTAHSAIGLAMDDSASLVATTGTFHFTTSNATAWASGQFNLSSNGSIIQYATGYVACGVGTGSYQLDAWVTRKE